MLEHKILCLFVHYNANQRLDNYVLIYLKYLKKLNIDIVFISNSLIPQQHKDTLLQEVNCSIHERENKGGDFGAWSWAINQQLIPANTDYLLLANDSVLGPLNDLSVIIETMSAKKNIDFWGITDSLQGDWHIQSYFICFSQKVFSGVLFKEFFRQNFDSLDKKKIIRLGEIQLSQMLITNGFAGEAYIGYKNFLVAANGEKHNPTHFFWSELIRDFNYPFLKKDLIEKNPEHFLNLLDLFEFIDTNTSYPVGLLIELFTKNRIKKDKRKDVILKPLVICHMFFYDMALLFIDQLIILLDYNASFVFNISAQLQANKPFLKILRTIFPGCIIINSPNQGRDIGGKFAGLDMVLRLNLPSDITLIIHDKKSLHLGNGEVWRDELFKIIDAEYLPAVFEKFENKKEIGIISTVNFIQDEYLVHSDTFDCTSNAQIKIIMNKYDIHTKDYKFVAGNIFWIRSELLKKFFETRSLFEIRSELEKGNALDFGNGTFIHSWERIMSWIATSQGYKIYGV